jgi:phosphate transport system permease protein
MASSSVQEKVEPVAPPPPPPAVPPVPPVPRHARLGSPRREPRWREFQRQGIPAVWFTGVMVLAILLMVTGMMALILGQGLRHLWPAPLVQVRTDAGAWLGPIVGRETVPAAAPEAPPIERWLVKIGNRDVYGLDFRWFDVGSITDRSQPADAVVVERREHGNLHGRLRRIQDGEQIVAENEPAWDGLGDALRAARTTVRGVERLDRELEALRAPAVALERDIEARRRQGASSAAAEAELAAERARIEAQSTELEAARERAVGQLASRVAVFETADGRERPVRLDAIVRAYRPNAMSVWAKMGYYGTKLREFVFSAPRESNTEGGIFPALFGTILMVLLMTIAVVPLGVIAALYMHEYARQGPALRAVRLAVSNLAGVPSIVFGMFGLAFFVYGVGGAIDRALFADALPNPTFGTGGLVWASLTLALLTLPVVIVATEEGLAAVPRANREGSLALGATQWQTLRHVVIPNALPGILTGVILAVSRGAGEVAPLMLTGVVKLAPDLAIDASFPFVHLERKFMHLGFHIYDVSMQSPNVEAAKPMVYTTTLLLLLLVVALNATAIVMRNRMRRRYRGAAL